MIPNSIRILKCSVFCLSASLLLLPERVGAHCEVPCGIYGDQLRFESMLEDQRTIAKSIDEIAKHLTSMKKGPTPLEANQVTRWVVTKEDHATRIQHTIAQYFMTQRLKPADGEAAKPYLEKLAAAHAVMRGAMKTKQDPSPEAAAALRTAILDFYRAYEGKEPDLE